MDREKKDQQRQGRVDAKGRDIEKDEAKQPKNGNSDGKTVIVN